MHEVQRIDVMRYAAFPWYQQNHETNARQFKSLRFYAIYIATNLIILFLDATIEIAQAIQIVNMISQAQGRIQGGWWGDASPHQLNCQKILANGTTTLEGIFVPTSIGIFYLVTLTTDCA
jgi:hypothetical protein